MDEIHWRDMAIAVVLTAGCLIGFQKFRSRSQTKVGIDTAQGVPRDVQDRLDAWFWLFQRACLYQYVFGIGGLILSIVSTGYQEQWLYSDMITPSARILTPIFVGIVAFIKPDIQYLKYAAAWRLLSLAVMRYRRKLLSEEGLCDAVEQGERIIAEFERKEEQKPQTNTTPPTHNGSVVS